MATRSARVNIKLIVILASSTILLTGGALGGHYLRKRIVAQNALERGRAACEAGEWAEGARHLRRYLQQHEDDAAVWEEYAAANMSVEPLVDENFALALRAYRHLFALDPTNTELCRTIVQLYMKAKEYTEAKYFCLEYLQHVPDDPWALFKLATSQFCQIEDADAMETLQQLIRLNPEEVRPYGLISRIILRSEASDRIEHAAEWLDRCVKENPANSGALVQRSTFKRMRQMDVVGARRDLEAAEVAPTTAEAALAIADEWAAHGDVARAKAALVVADQLPLANPAVGPVDEDDFRLTRFLVHRQVALSGRNPDDCEALGDEVLEAVAPTHRPKYLPDVVDLYLVAGNVDKAAATIAEYESLLKSQGLVSHPRHIERLMLMKAGLATVQLNHYEVVEILQPEVGVSIQAIQGWRMLWNAYEATGQSRRLISSLESYANSHPQDAATNLRLAKLYRLVDWNKSRDYATAAESAGSTLDSILQRIEADIAVSAAMRHRLRSIAGELQALRAAHPTVARIRVLEADLALRNGQIEAALGHIDRAVVDCPDDADLIVIQAELNESLDQIDEAVALLEAGISMFPGDVMLRLALVRVLMTSGRQPAAAEALASAMAELEGPERNELIYFQVSKGLRDGHKDDAVRLLQELRRSSVDDVRCRLALLEIWAVTSIDLDPQAVVDEIRQIEGESGLRWRVKQASVYLESTDWAGREPEIRALLDHCIDSDSMWAEPVLLAGQLLEKRREYHIAERTYKQFVEAYPRSIEVISRLLTILERKQRFAEAAEIMDRLPPDPGRFGLRRATVAVGLGDYRSAVELLRQRIEAEPEAAVPRVMLARILYMRDADVDGALALLDEVHRTAPDLIEAIAARSQILSREGREAEAAELIDSAVQRRGDFAAFALRAAHRAWRGEHDLAEADYKHMTTLDQDAARSYLLWGTYLYRNDRRVEAIDVWQQGVASFPKSQELGRTLVSALLESGEAEQVSQGRVLLNAFLEAYPDNPELLFFAVLSVPPRETTQRLAQLDHVIQLDPSHVGAHAMAIRILRATGELAQAERRVIQSLGANPRNLELTLLRAEIEFSLRHHREARQFAEDVLRRRPANRAAHMLLARIAALESDWARTEAHIEAMLSAAPDEPSGHLLKAQVNVLRGRRDEAVQGLQTYVDTTGTACQPCLLQLVELYCEDKNPGAAATYLERAIELDPQNPDLATTRLRFLAAAGRFDDLDRAIPTQQRATPRDLELVNLGATLLADAGRIDRARALFLHAIELADTHVPSILGLAQIAHRADDLEAAEASYRRVLDLDAYNRQALNDLAWILGVRLSRWQDALPLAVRGVERYPSNAHLLDTRAVIYLNLGQYDNARRDLQRCIKNALPPTLGSAWLHLAEVFLAEGNAKEASAMLQQAQRVDLTAEQRQKLETLLERASQ
jgi:tetratricopeptide (TPR) repeat protein